MCISKMTRQEAKSTHKACEDSDNILPASAIALLQRSSRRIDWSAANIDPNAVLRGAQLTVVGAWRALQNPRLFKQENYRQAAIAVAAGIALKLMIAAPTTLIRILMWLLSFVFDYSQSTWDESMISGLDFVEKSVLQIPFFLMTLMKYLTPALDNMFMESLAWVDTTYALKHQSQDASQLRGMYHQNLEAYTRYTGRPEALRIRHGSPYKAAWTVLSRHVRRGALSLTVYALSFVPHIGRFVLPTASFYALNRAIGITPAVGIFSTSIFIPRRYIVIFLQTYFSSRALVRELLEPYFSRIKFTPAQKRKWFRDREGLLFGFGVGFYLLLQIPLLGILIYGIAEASTAYLITKITDPPPLPAKSADFAESQVCWRNRHEFMSLSMANLDGRISRSVKPRTPHAEEMVQRT